MYSGRLVEGYKNVRRLIRAAEMFNGDEQGERHQCPGPRSRALGPKLRGQEQDTRGELRRERPHYRRKGEGVPGGVREPTPTQSPRLERGRRGLRRAPLWLASSTLFTLAHEG